jgi:cyclopropane fatty-acyl-phospholipid synthase-like methyltransferase
VRSEAALLPPADAEPEPLGWEATGTDGTMSKTYVYGYHVRESLRLEDQAGTLVGLLLSDAAYPDGSLLLEAGCGVGAQTVALAPRSPGARFIFG